MRKFLMFTLLCLLAVMPILAQDDEAAVTLRLVSYDSFNVSEDVLAAFTEETGIVVEILRLADAGAMVNQVILTKENPLGDVLYGIDNTFLSRGLDAELFLPYESPLLEDVDPALILDDAHRVTPVTFGDVCLNYDTAYFADNELPLPESLGDLAAPDYAGLLAVQNPATSSPGLAFLLATVAAFGEEGDYTYLDFWADLRANDVLVTEGWTEAYYGAFSATTGDGQRPLVVSYASSPPAEVFFAEEAPDTPPTGAIVAPLTCFRQVEFVGILDGTPHEDAAQQFIDFLLSVDFQEDLPLSMFVFPVNPEAQLPEVFAEYAVIPDEPVTLDYAEIEAGREGWIRAWTETVLR